MTAIRPADSCEIGRRPPQDLPLELPLLLGLAQPAVLRSEPGQFLVPALHVLLAAAVIAASVFVGLAHPAVQRVAGHPDVRRDRRIRALPTRRAVQRHRIVPELRRIRRPTSHQDTLPRIHKIHCQSVHTAGGTSVEGALRRRGAQAGERQGAPSVFQYLAQGGVDRLLSTGPFGPCRPLSLLTSLIPRSGPWARSRGPACGRRGRGAVRERRGERRMAGREVGR